MDEQKVWLDRILNERPEAGNTPTSDNGLPRRVEPAKFAIDLFGLGIRLAEDYLPPQAQRDRG